MFLGRFTEIFQKLGRKRSKKELDEHYEGMDLEKGDFLAMVIAAFITFFPVLIILIVVIYGMIWLVMVR